MVTARNSGNRKESILKRKKLLPMGEDPFSDGNTKTILIELPPQNVYPFPMNNKRSGNSALLITHGARYEIINSTLYKSAAKHFCNDRKM